MPRHTSKHLLSPHRLGSRAALIIGVTASRFVKSFSLRETQNHAGTIQLLICILDQVPICISNSPPLLELIIFFPLWGESGMILLTFLGAMVY